MITLNVLVLCAFVAVVKSQAVKLDPYYTTYNSPVVHADNYLNAHRRQFLANIWIYDYQIQTFKTLYTERINTLTIQQNLLIDSLIQTNERLYPLELLSDFDKDCVDKYKKLIPPVSAVKYNMESCITAAQSQLNSLVLNPSATNKTLQTYYLNTFEKSVQTCQRNYPAAGLNYTTCLQSAISAANVNTINNQNIFANQMDSSASSAQVYVKRAMECSFGVQNSTIASIAQANTLTDKCIQGLDNCKQCSGYYCENVYNIQSSWIDPNNQNMRNVFYGSNPNVKCLMLDVY